MDGASSAYSLVDTIVSELKKQTGTKHCTFGMEKKKYIATTRK